MAGYLGNAPTAVPLSSADLQDGIITSAKIADSTIALADLSATGTKDATTFLRGDNSFATVSSDFVRIATTTISSSVATVDFTSVFTSTYDRYMITVDNIVVDSGTYVGMRVIYSTNTVDTTTSYVQVGYGATVTTGNTASSLSITSYNGYGELYLGYNGALASGTGTEGKGMCATIQLSTPANTTNGKAMTMQSGFYNGTTYNSQNSFWYYRSTNAITGFRFLTITGGTNMTSGTISIYGLKKS